MSKKPGGYLGGTTTQFIELGERLAELERQEFDSKCLDVAKAMQAAVVAALPVVEAAVALTSYECKGPSLFDDYDYCVLYRTFEKAVETWRGSQSGAQG